MQFKNIKHNNEPSKVRRLKTSCGLVNNLVSNNDGIALLTVLLITIILSLLAMVAISTTGDDVINAGNSTASQYTFNMANSGMSMVLSQIYTGQGTNAGVECAGLPLSGWYYYSLNGNPNCQASAPPPPPTQPTFTPANNINSYFSGLILNFPGNTNQFGFEYSGFYGPLPGYSYPQFAFYKGTINFLTQKNTSSVIQTGMTFNYGPVQGYP